MQLSQLLEVPVEIDLMMKSVTEKDIINRIEEEFRKKEELKKEDRKILQWSNDGGDTDRTGS